MNLARLSRKTIDREADKSLPQARGYSESSGEGFEHHRSQHRSQQHGKSPQHTKSTAERHHDISIKNTAKHGTDKSARKNETGKRNVEEKSSQHNGKSSTSKTSKKKAEEPIESISTASPPKTSKKTTSNAGKQETRKDTSDSPKPSPRKTRLRSRTIDVPTVAARSTTSNVFVAKQINADSDSPKPEKRSRLRLKLPQMDGAHDVGKRKPRTKAVVKKSDDSSDEASSGSDFQPTSPKRSRSKVNLNRSKSKSKSTLNKSTTNSKKSIDRRVFSSEDETTIGDNTNSMDFWIEAYAEKEKKWIAIDPVKRKVDCVDFVRVSTRICRFS